MTIEGFAFPSEGSYFLERADHAAVRGRFTVSRNDFAWYRRRGAQRTGGSTPRRGPW